MRVTSFLYGSVAFAAVLVQALPSPTPITGSNRLAARGIIDDIFGSSNSSTNSTTSATSEPSCGVYTGPDATDLSQRDFIELEKRVKEEYWFRFEDASILNEKTGILQLAARGGAKNYDDQAYKWISTDASKVSRGFPGRLSTIHVLPAGTRAAVLGAAQNFETTSGAKQAADFVTKDNEPGDVGINGVAVSASNGQLPLDTFRAKVIRSVVKVTSAKGKGKVTYTTITKGKFGDGASKADQKALEKFC